MTRTPLILGAALAVLVVGADPVSADILRCVGADGASEPTAA